MEAACVEDRLQHYELRRLLGEGGFGHVYEAWDAKLCRRIAIKQLKRGATLANGSLVREARLAASLRHPAFVKIFSLDGQGARQSIVMELIDGCTLQTHASRSPPCVDIALRIVRQVAEAMAEAHASGLVHGDLKPSNLMIDAAGNVRILDFGLARQLDAEATCTSAASDAPGTIAYMAPELLRGATPDQLGDIYSLGVILYELVSGARPFSHLHGLALAAAHLQSSSDSWRFPSDTQESLISLVRVMTQSDAQVRMPTMQAVLAALDELPGKAATSAPIRARLGAVRRRWRAVVAMLMAGFALSLSIGEQLPTQPLATFTFSEAGAMRAGLDALRIYDRNDSLDTAIHSFDSILSRRPDHAGAAAGMSLAYSLRYASDRQDDAWLGLAVASARQAVKLDSQLALAHAAEARVHFFRKDMSLAIESADHALRIDPSNLWALSCKIDALLSLRRFDEAEQVIAAATVFHPRERLFADARGVLQTRRNDFAAAEKSFRYSIALDPDASLAYANLNAVLLKQNRSDEALQVLQQGLQIRPSARLYGNLGTALFARGDYVGAADAFSQAISEKKGNPRNYLNWANLADALRWIPGRAAASQEAYGAAANLLQPLLDKSPNDVTRLSRMGLYRAKLGEYSSACDAAARALALAPSDADVQFRASITFELSGMRGAALDAVAAARTLGYPTNLIDSEPDLAGLRRDTRFYYTLAEDRK